MTDYDALKRSSERLFVSLGFASEEGEEVGEIGGRLLQSPDDVSNTFGREWDVVTPIKGVVESALIDIGGDSATLANGAMTKSDNRKRPSSPGEAIARKDAKHLGETVETTRGDHEVVWLDDTTSSCRVFYTGIHTKYLEPARAAGKIYAPFESPDCSDDEEAADGSDEAHLYEASATLDSSELFIHALQLREVQMRCELVEILDDVLGETHARHEKFVIETVRRALKKRGAAAVSRYYVYDERA